MDAILDNLANARPDELIPLVAIITIFGGGIVLGAIGIVFGSITAIVRSKEIEKSRREVAAYVAEGSISPEEGERLLRANRGRKGKA